MVILVIWSGKASRIPVDIHALVREPENQPILSKAILTIYDLAVSFSVISRTITHGRQVVGNTIRPVDIDIALTLGKNTGNHCAGMIFPARVDITTCMNPVSLRNR